MKGVNLLQTSSESPEEREAPVSMTLEGTPVIVDSNEDATIPNIRIISTEEQERTQTEAITESDNVTPNEGNN